MKRSLLLLGLVAVLGLPTLARAETTPFAKPGRFGLGVGTSTLSTGVTGKYYFSETFALQGTAGFWYWRGSGVNLNVDAIFELPKFYSNNAISLNGHLGFGGALGFYGRRYNSVSDRYGYEGAGLGLEAVGGLGLQIKSVPLELVLDVRPAYYFSDGWWGGAWIGTGASIRYFFK